MRKRDVRRVTLASNCSPVALLPSRFPVWPGR
jgi:hypothetical protein